MENRCILDAGGALRNAVGAQLDGAAKKRSMLNQFAGCGMMPQSVCFGGALEPFAIR
jgi:hypothetical protein